LLTDSFGFSLSLSLSLSFSLSLCPVISGKTQDVVKQGVGIIYFLEQVQALSGWQKNLRLGRVQDCV
jgi:hypothetical protein